MNVESALEIDHFNPQSSRKILVYRPALSSQNLNWDGMIFNYHLRNARELPEHIQPNHMLCMSLNNITTDERLNGKFASIYSRYGSLTILPKGYSYGATWQQEPQFATLSIKTDKFLKFAPESIIPESIELIGGSAIKPDQLITGIFINFQKEIAQGISPHDPLIEHLQNALLAHLLRNYCSQKYRLKSFNGLPPRKLKLALNYINDNLLNIINLADIAELLDISPGYFGRLFRESMGIPPHQYIANCRIEKAQQLIKNHQSKLSLTEIARQSGFPSVNHFCRRFRQLTGLSPQQYQDSL